MSFVEKLSKELSKGLADVGFTKPQVVRLGYGDGSGRIVQNPVDRTVYTFVGDIGDAQREIGTAILSQAAGILLQDSKQAEGLYVEIAIPPGKSQPHVTGMAGSTGLQAAGGKTQLEQILARAALPDLSKIATLRARPVSGANEITVDGVFVYTQPSTGLLQSFDGASISLQDSIDALAIGEHQLIGVCLNAETGVLTLVSNAATAAAGTLPSRAEFTVADVLSLPTLAYIPIIAAYTYSGQTAISEADLYRQYDPRPLFRPTVLNKLDATAAPGVGDDSADGYTVGSTWLDVTADKSYICLDATAGAAVWKETSNAAGGAGTVTSVALAAPAIFTVSGSPVTTSGTLTLALATQTANTVWAGPTSGGAATPTFRGIVSADLTTALTTPPVIGGTTPANVFTTNLNIRPTSADGFRTTREAANNLFRFYQYGTGTNIFEGYKAGGTESSATATGAGDTSILIAGYGHTGSAFTASAATAIRLRLTETTTGGANGSDMAFEVTRNTTTARTERLTLAGGGTLTSIIEDTATAAGVDVWTVNLRSSGTAAANFGAGLLFNLESSTTNDQNAGRVKVDWQTATHASRAGRMTFSVWNVATERTALTLQANSARSSIGFHGASPVEAPDWTAATGTATRATFATGTVTLAALAQAVKAIIDDLLAYGLFR